MGPPEELELEELLDEDDVLEELLLEVELELELDVELGAELGVEGEKITLADPLGTSSFH